MAALVRQRRRFSSPEGDLLRFLAATGQLLSAVRSQDCHSLVQTRSLIHELKVLRAAAVWGPRGVILWQAYIPSRFQVFHDVLVQVCSLQWAAGGLGP